MAACFQGQGIGDDRASDAVGAIGGAGFRRGDEFALYAAGIDGGWCLCRRSPDFRFGNRQFDLRDVGVVNAMAGVHLEAEMAFLGGDG